MWKNHRRRFSFSTLALHWQLALFLACALPLLWSVIAFDLHRLHRQIFSESRSETINLVRAFAEEVKSSVNAIDYTLIDLREEWQTRDSVQKFAATVQRRQSFLEKDVAFQVAILDADGLLAFSSVDPQARPADFSDREHFFVHRNRSSDELFISKPLLGRVSHRWTIQFTRPLKSESGAFAGVIVLSVSPDYFSRFYKTIDLGADNSITLVKQSGEVLARSPNPELGMGKRIIGRPFQLVDPRRDNGIYIEQSAVDGIKRLFGWRALPDRELIVIIGQSIDSLFLPYRNQRRIHLLAGAGISILLALIGYVFLQGLRQRAASTAALADSEARWNFALEGAGDGVWDWDIRNSRLDVSKNWQHIVGFPKPENDNYFNVWRSHIHPDDLPQVLARLQSHLQGEHPTYISEHRVIIGEGDWKWVLERGMVVKRTQDGHALRMVGTLSDITQRKEDEQTLHRALAQTHAEQERMKIILDHSHDAFIALDAEGRITDWNRQAERTFGWTAAEAIGQLLGDLILPPESRETHDAGLRRFTASGKITVSNNVIELEALDRSGQRIPVEIAVAEYQYGDQHAITAFIRDIRERKEAEKQEAMRRAALEEARAALQQSQKMEAVGKLTGGVAHDFNNALQIIRGNLDLLQIHLGTNPQAEKRLDLALAAVDRGAKLSSQLLAFARRQPLRPQVVNIGRLLKNMDDLMHRALDESIQIHVIIDAELWNTYLDASQFENVILNLIINARDAIHGSGTVTIEASNIVLTDEEGNASKPALPAGQYVLFALSDTGSGMTPEVMEHAFEPFFTTKAEGEGTGLGLSMAYGFVKQSGGHIRLSSEVGSGTTVRIFLPRSYEHEAAVPAERPDEELVGGKETILVVEDDADVQTTVVAILTELGYHVLKASDAQAGLKVLQSGVSVDLLFTDVIMPGPLRSPELAKQAKLMHPDIAVLFTSGYTRNAIDQGGNLDPGVHLLSKPYRRDQLARKVRSILSKPAPAPDSGAAVIKNAEQAEPAMPSLQQVLIVEDNDDLRGLASEMFSILGYRAHQAATAEDALAILNQGAADVLFTDVRLPGMSGIELAEKAAAMYPSMKIIYATGLSEVADAKTVSTLVVKKPYNLSQLVKALEGG